MRKGLRLFSALALGWVAALAGPGARAQPFVALEAFYGLLNQNEAAAQKSLQRIRAGWRNEYASMLLELAGFMPSRETQLEINEARNVQVDPAARVLRLSAIFRFHTDDFLAAAPGLAAYVNRYRADPAPESYRVEFIAYDWTLNARRAAP